MGRRALAHLVALDALVQVAVALRVVVVGPDEDAFLAGGDGEGADAGHDVADDLAGAKQVDEAGVLAVQLAVPVDLGVVEAEDALVLAHLDVEVVGPGEDLVAERAELGLGAHVRGLVDHRPDVRVLVHQHLRNHPLVGHVVLPQVEVRHVARRVEALRDPVVHVALLRRDQHLHDVVW